MAAGRVIAGLAAALCLAVPAASPADVFNGRIAFSSQRVEPAAGAERAFDIFTRERRRQRRPQAAPEPGPRPAGRLVADSRNLAFDRQAERDEELRVARMTAAGTGYRRLTTSPADQASSQPSWRPDRKGILFRRSGPDA